MPALPPLVAAAAAGDVDRARALLDGGADVDARTQSGDTALLTAAFRGMLDVARLCVERGADPNAQTAGGTTPLLVAASGGRLDVLRFLLDHGGDPRAGRDVNGWGPLHAIAARTGPSGFAALGTPLGVDEIADAVRRLVRAGAPIDARDDRGNTALYLECGGHGPDEQSIVPALLEAGADPRARCERGRTPLHEAAARRTATRARWLLEAGAGAADRDELGWTPPMIALAEDSGASAQLLEALGGSGARLAARAVDAARAGRVADAVETLDSDAAEIDAADLKVSMLFAGLAHGAVVRALLERGAAVETRHFGGATALYHASDVGAEDGGIALLEAGADPCARAPDGSTALAAAWRTFHDHKGCSNRALLPRLEQAARERGCA